MDSEVFQSLTKILDISVVDKDISLIVQNYCTASTTTTTTNQTRTMFQSQHADNTRQGPQVACGKPRMNIWVQYKPILLCPGAHLQVMGAQQ